MMDIPVLCSFKANERGSPMSILCVYELAFMTELFQQIFSKQTPKHFSLLVHHWVKADGEWPPSW